MGLLTPGAFGKSPLDKKPKKVGGGLLTPVVAFKGLRSGTPTDRPGEEMLEGGGIGPRGGGGSRSFGSHGTARRTGQVSKEWETTTAPGRGDVRVKVYPEEKGWSPSFVNQRPTRPGEVRGREARVTVDTPSGQTVTFDMWNGKANMDFFPTRGGGNIRPPLGTGALQHTTNTFGHVIKSMRSFVRAYQPKTIHYYGANRELQRLYDRASPKLAEGLGGIHRQDGIHHYIEFGDD